MNFIWLLVAINPVGEMTFLQDYKYESICAQEAARLAIESRQHFPQPNVYTCIPSSGLRGSLRKP